MKRVFEFICNNNHYNERYVDDTVRTVDCETCNSEAHRIVSAPRIQLEGCSGDFPGAAMRWEQKRAQKQAVQARKERDHGDSGW